MKFRFTGGSDDLVIVVTETTDLHEVEEYNAYSNNQVTWCADLIAPDGSAVRIAAIYSDVWAFAVSQTAEDEPMPSWPISVTQDEETYYSALLEIEAPDGTEIANVWPKVEDA